MQSIIDQEAGENTVIESLNNEAEVTSKDIVNSSSPAKQVQKIKPDQIRYSDKQRGATPSSNDRAAIMKQVYASLNKKMKEQTMKAAIEQAKQISSSRKKVNSPKLISQRVVKQRGGIHSSMVLQPQSNNNETSMSKESSSLFKVNKVSATSKTSALRKNTTSSSSNVNNNPYCNGSKINIKVNTASKNTLQNNALKKRTGITQSTINNAVSDGTNEREQMIS